MTRVVAALWLLGGPARADQVQTFSQVYDGAHVRAPAMLLTAGARPTALGDAYAAVVDDPTALWWNPAGLAEVGGFGLHLSIDSNADFGNVYAAAESHPLGPVIVGIALRDAIYDGFSTRDAQGSSIGAWTSTSRADLVVSAGAAMRHSIPGTRGGATGLALEHGHDQGNTTFNALSLGTRARLHAPLTVAAVLGHLGPGDGTFALPATARVGAAWDPSRWVLVASDLAVGIVDGAAIWSLGTEARLAFFQLRAGLNYDLRGHPGPDGSSLGLCGGFGFKFSTWDLDCGISLTTNNTGAARVSYTYREPALGVPHPFKRR